MQRPRLTRPLGGVLPFGGFIVSAVAAQSSAPERDGVFRYDITNLTARKVSVADGRQIVYGPYRAYFRVFTLKSFGAPGTVLAGSKVAWRLRSDHLGHRMEVSYEAILK